MDEFLGADVPIDQKVTVKLIVWDADEAQREVERLNALQKDDGVRYFAQTTRIQPAEVPAAGSAPVQAARN